MNRPQILAHRGLSGSYPENTHAAFRAAWETNCDGIELDIQVTQDGQVVAIHDPDTERTSGEKLIVADVYYSDLRDINVGIGGKGGSDQFDERIPLLLDVVAEVPTGKTIQIEIKHHITDMYAVVSTFSQLRDDINVQIISFDANKLLRVRQELPHLDCFLVMDEEMPKITDRIGFALDNGFKGLDMDFNIAEPNYIKAVLAAGLQVAHWTVNDGADAKRLIAQGAQFLASDYADELKKLIV